MSDDDLEKMMSRLKGTFKHYCPDWDDLPIDETTPEFAACTCFPDFLKPERTE